MYCVNKPIRTLLIFKFRILVSKQKLMNQFSLHKHKYKVIQRASFVFHFCYKMALFVFSNISFLPIESFSSKERDFQIVDLCSTCLARASHCMWNMVCHIIYQCKKHWRLWSSQTNSFKGASLFNFHTQLHIEVFFFSFNRLYMELWTGQMWLQTPGI